MNNVLTAKLLNAGTSPLEFALQEQLRQFSDQAKSKTESAPLPDSAYEAADRLISQHLSAPPTPSKPRLSVDDVDYGSMKSRGLPQVPDTISKINDAASWVNPVGLLSNTAPMMLDAVNLLGGLTPDQADADQAETIKTLEERQDELTRRTAFPGLIEMDDERGSQREVVGGGTGDLLQDMQRAQNVVVEGVRQNVRGEERKELATELPEKMQLAKTIKPTQQWWANAIHVAARSAGQTGLHALKYGPAVYESVAELLSGDKGETTEIRAWLQQADKKLAEVLPGDPAKAKDFMTELAAGGGSYAAFLLGGFITSSIGLPAGIGAGVIGAAASGSSQYEEAEQFKAAALPKFLALLAGTGLGATEAIPIERMFLRADMLTGGLVTRMLATTVASGLEEFVQEFGQTVGEDAAAMLLYDENREIDLMKATRAGFAGLLTGVGGNIVTQAATEYGLTQAIQQEMPVEKREEFARNVIDILQKEADTIAASAEARLDLDEEAIVAPQIADPTEIAAVIDAADMNLPPLAQDAITAFTAIPANAFQSGKDGGGIMSATALERAVRGEDTELATALETSFAPVREQLREAVGDTIRLYRAQLPVDTTRGVVASGMPADGTRAVLSWTTDPDVADYFAGVRRTRALFTDEQIDEAVRVYEETGEVKLPGTEKVLRGLNEYIGFDGKPRTSIDIYDGEEFITDTDSVRSYMEEMNDSRAEAAEAEARKRERIVSAEVALDDVVWVTNRGGQSEFMVRNDPAGSVYIDPTGQLRQQDEIDAMRAPRKKLQLADQVAGWRGVSKYLTEDEKAPLRKASAEKLVALVEQLPSAEEMAAVAVSARAKRGWYKRSAQALVDTFGLEDAPRFAALLAALSPQTSVESNAYNALKMWTNWNRAGRPTTRKAIEFLMGQSVQGDKGEQSVLTSWKDNTVRALAAKDATTVRISGPKVSSFMLNLQGVTNEVTNDAWMANYANVEQALFAASYRKTETGEKLGQKSIGYAAMSAAVRKAAEAATKITGQPWTPAEIQETVWSWAKTLYEKRNAAGENRRMVDILMAGDLTAEDIAGTPDFATLFANGVYRNILEEGNYVVKTDGRGAGPAEVDGGAGSVISAEGTGFAQSAFERHLRRAARRLEGVREKRLAAKAAKAKPGEVVTDSGLDEDAETTTIEDVFPGDLDSDRGNAQLLMEDTFDDIDLMVVSDKDLTRLPGLPPNSSGPVASVVQAARAYAKSIGIPFRRQATYVKADPERGRRIAEAYEQMQHAPEDPAVKAAYQAMIDETLAQFQFVKASGLDIDFIEPGQADPYPGGPREVLDDLQRGHLWVFPTDQGFGTLSEAEQSNPLLAETDEVVKGRKLLANDVFRIVHDFFGHGLEGAGFGARGEENAWQAHMRLYTKAALPAVTSETRGQNSWVNFGPYGESNRANQRETTYADQKTGIMPSWTWQEGVDDDSSISLGDGPVTASEFADGAAPTQEMLSRPGWAILTGTQEALGPWTAPENVASNDRLRAELAGTDAIEITGSYEGVDQGPSWIVFATPEEALEIAKRYGQESILTNEGLDYGDGTIVQADPMMNTVGEEARQQPFFSVMPNGNAFSVGLDFDTGRVPRAEAVFAGTMAVAADRVDLDALDVAQQMARDGRSMDDIWEATGFFKGKDDRWRFEISDADARFGKDALSGLTPSRPDPGPFWTGMAYGQLGDMLVHPRLFEAYPFLKKADVHLRVAPGSAISGLFQVKADGSYAIKAQGKSLDELMSVLLHEVQHAIQAQEGFSRGGNLSDGELYEGDEVEKLQAKLAELNVELKALVAIPSSEMKKGWGSEVKALKLEIEKTEAELRGAAKFAYYHRIAGEVEARNVQKRFEALNEGRKLAAAGAQLEPVMMPPPPRTEDVARDKQVVVYRTGLSLATDMMAQNTSVTPPAGRGTGYEREAYRAERSRPDQGVANTGQAGDAELTLSKISGNFIRFMGLTARQGRLTIRGANVMGQFSRKSGVIRLKSMNDLSTLVHEAGHALHDARSALLNTFVQNNSRALQTVGTKLYGGDLTYASKETHEREGFAEFFRVYVLNKAWLEVNAPTLLQDFDALLDQHAPELKRGLELTRQQHDAWLQMPSTAMFRNMIVSAIQPRGINAAIKELREVGFNTWFSEVSRRAVAESVNRFASMDTLVGGMLNVGQTNTGGAIDLKVADDPRKLIRMARNSSSRAMVELTDGVYGYRSMQPVSRGLREALTISQGFDPSVSTFDINEDRYNDFNGYIVALRAIDEYRRMSEGKIARAPVSLTLGEAIQAVTDFEAKYGASFTKAAGIVHEYGMALWQKSYDAGLMSKETYLLGLDRKFYAPMQRDMSDRGNNDLGPNVLTGGRPLGQKFRGSGRDVVDPLAVLMHKTFALENIIAQNDIIKAMAALADRTKGAGALVERIPASKMVANVVSVEQVARQIAKDDRINADDAQDLMELVGDLIDQKALIHLFRAEQASTRGENVLFFWENGKVAAIQLMDGDVGSDIVRAMTSLGPENVHTAFEIIAMTSSLFRSAITAWPDFLIVNYIRDQMSAWVLTDVGFTPFVSGAKGVISEVTQNEWSKQYNVAMGIMGGMNVATMHEARVNRDIDALRSKGYLARAFSGHGLKGAVAGLGKVVELTETGTRLGIFEKAYKRAKADGLTDYEAATEAAYTATDYIDFGLNGTKMLVARRTIPFLNAQLQGLYKMMRTLGNNEVRQRKGLKFALTAFFKDINQLELSRAEKMAVRTGRKAWVKMSILGLLGAILTFAFEDDPDYQETSEYLRTTGWVIPVGGNRIVYVPKPFELAIISNIVERAIEHAAGDPEAKNRFLRGVAMTLVPPTSPPAIQSVVEYAANYDFFGGREIVPENMQGLEPWLQYNNYTSEIAKKVGEITGWSPMVLDHFMSSLGASAFRDIATMTNALDPDRPSMSTSDMPILRRFYRDARRGSVAAQDFWDLAAHSSGDLVRAANTYKSLTKSNENAAARYLSELSPDKQAFAVLNTHFEAEYKRLNPFYRARDVAGVISRMRREMGSDLGLEDTSKFADGAITLTARQKLEVDEVLSEYARREVRNTLIATQTGGWGDKRVLQLAPTAELLEELSPEVAAELNRRLKKAKVYSADIVYEYWPEVRDRLIQDREDAFLKDILTLAKAMPL